MASYSKPHSCSNSNSPSKSYSYTIRYFDFILNPEQGLDDVGAAVRRGQTRDEGEVTEQVVSESLPQPEGLEPSAGDVEQSCNNHDGVDTKHHDTPLSGYDPFEDDNPLREKYMQDKFSDAVTEPEFNTRSVTSQVRDSQLTPEQIDQLLKLWETPELIEEHHRSRLIRDLEREDRVAEEVSKEEKEAYIYKRLDGIPDESRGLEWSCGNAV
ncbi:hypothetical protein KCU81_g5196, partial [Aureobasidium melanogenum]|uniref:Uncharacterized protein n=1 Tax=Aureobasidium melanogenum (strain CBS 110374) TaxID=1043003 RepID=A0A074W1G0_AURM1